MEPQRLQPADLIADAARDLTRQSYAPQPPIEGVALDDVPVHTAPDGLFAELARLDGDRQVTGFPGFRPVQWNWSVLEPGAVKAWHLHRERKLREEAEARARDPVAPAGSRSERRAPARRRLLGDLLIRDGLITRAQRDAALRTQQERGTYTPIGQILVDGGLITQEQLKVVLEKYDKTYRIGDILVETNAITQEQLDLALQHQKKTGLRLGDVLLRLGLVTEARMKDALCRQLRIGFVDLDHFAIDRSIAHLLNRRYAQQRRVIPIGRSGSCITLAIDDPTDVDAIEELESSTGCRIEVVTSTSAAFDRAFRRTDERPAEAEEPRARRDIGPKGEAGAAAPDEGAGASTESRWTLAELTAARDALRRDLEAATQALHELRERYSALLRDRQEVADKLDAVLRRLKA